MVRFKLSFIIKSFTVLIISALLFNIDITTSKPLINASNSIFIDRDNRIRIFHGMNIFNKEPPYSFNLSDNTFYYKNSISNIDVSFLVDLGINLVRIGVVWEGYETEKGEFNEDYLENINSLINKLGEVGIFTVLTNYQTLFSSKFCGAGVPLFYLSNYSTDCSADLFSNISKLLGFCVSITEAKQKESCDQIQQNHKYQTSIEISTLYNQIYNEKSDLFRAYATYWNRILKRFYQHRYIISFDPWYNLQASDVHNSILSNIPSYQANSNILLFYKNIEKITAGDNSVFSNPLYPDSNYIRFSGFNSTPSSNFKIHTENIVCNDEKKCESMIYGKIQSIISISSKLNVTPLVNAIYINSIITTEQEERLLSVFFNEAHKHNLSWIYNDYKPFSNVSFVYEWYLILKAYL